jgi:hypothetical protein
LVKDLRVVDLDGSLDARPGHSDLLYATFGQGCTSEKHYDYWHAYRS